VIENRLPKKQKAQSGISAEGLISIQLEVIGLCRRHQHNHVVKAPVRTPILAGAAITTAEAAMTAHTFIIRLSAVNLNRRNHSDLPQLHNRM